MREATLPQEWIGAMFVVSRQDSIRVTSMKHNGPPRTRHGEYGIFSVDSSLERPAVLVLFVAQGHHRVDPDCAKRRDVACKEGNRR